MLKSMTGFGRKEKEFGFGEVQVELRGINRKGFELNMNHDPFLSWLQTDLRSWIKESVPRGRVDLELNVFFKNQSPIKIHPNIPLAKSYKEACDALCSELQLEESLSLEELFLQEGIFSLEPADFDREEVKAAIKETLFIAIDSFIQMKTEEGKALEKEILSHLEICKKSIHEIENLSKDASSDYKEKLLARLQALQAAPMDERIIQEVALFAEKIDISEEIARFLSHYDQFIITIAKNNAQGKKLEFLSQEMLREATTIAAKSTQVSIIHLSVEIKAEIEKIREQLQNVE
jgi:uncharacterized protein (TIGR00255 family)